jgi:hypothetical protein
MKTRLAILEEVYTAWSGSAILFHLAGTASPKLTFIKYRHNGRGSFGIKKIQNPKIT